MTGSENLGTETLIKFYVERGELQNAQTKAQSIGRELNESELRTIRGKCISAGNVDDVVTCTSLLGEEIDDSMLENLLENVGEIMEKFRIAKAFSNKEKAKKMITEYIVELMKQGNESNAQILAEYLDHFDEKDGVDVDFGSGPNNIHIIRWNTVESCKFDGITDIDYSKMRISVISEYCINGKFKVKKSIAEPWLKVSVCVICEKCHTGALVEDRECYYCPKCHDEMIPVFVLRD